MYGERLRELRESKKLTQKQLAEKLGLNQQDISRYETEQIDLGTDLIIANFLKLAPIICSD